jgi:cobalamin synthase
MKFRQVAILLGPVAIRDLLVGSGGVAYGGVAFLLGFASVSQVHLVWFASWSILGLVSLANALPALTLVRNSWPKDASHG